MLLFNVQFNLQVVFCQLDLLCFLLIHYVSGHSLILDCFYKLIHILFDLLQSPIVTRLQLVDLFLLPLNSLFIYLLLSRLLFTFLAVIFYIIVFVDTRRRCCVCVSLGKDPIRHHTQPCQGSLHIDWGRRFHVTENSTTLVSIFTAIFSHSPASEMLWQVLPLLLLVEVSGAGGRLRGSLNKTRVLRCVDISHTI